MISDIEEDQILKERKLIILESQDAAFRNLPPGWMALIPGVQPIYYLFLFELVKRIKPKIIMELGTFQGASACVMAEGCLEAKVFSLDADFRFINDFCYRENIKFINQDSLDTRDEITKIDLLFIDTVHDGKRPKAEYEAWFPNLSKQAIVCFDDIWMNPPMKNFWESLKGDKMELMVHDRFGFGVILL